MSSLAIQRDCFTLLRQWPVPLERAFAIWIDPDLKARWFTGPKESWTLVRRMLDPRPGGIEEIEGRFAETGTRTLHKALYHVISEPDHLVFTYEMFLNQRLHSVSLASVHLLCSGTGTRMEYFEQVLFTDGSQALPARRARISAQLDQIDTLGLLQTPGQVIAFPVRGVAGVDTVL